MIETNDVIIVPYDKIYDVNPNGFFYLDDFEEDNEVRFQECANNYVRSVSEFLKRDIVGLEPNNCVAFRDIFADPPYFEFTARKPVIVIFRKRERVWFPQRNSWLFRAIKNRLNTDVNSKDFINFQDKILSMGWRLYDRG